MKFEKNVNLIERCEEVAGILKYLSHPQRLILLCKIAESPKTVGELQELCGLSQSQTSQFLALMKAEGLITSEKEGRFVYYRIHDDRVSRIIHSLNSVFCK